MNRGVTGRKLTGDKVYWLCQYFPDIIQHTVANLAMMHRRLAAWKFKFLFLALLLSFTSCGWFESDEFPTELLGRWVTDNPKYKGCYMIIETETIVFNTTENNLYKTAIEKIESATEFGRKVFHITYSDKDNIEYMLSVIVLKGGKKARLQFYNQRDLEWNRMDLNEEGP